MLDRLLQQDVLVYSILTSVGVTVFLFRVAMMMLGGVADSADIESDIDFDIDADVDPGDIHDSTADFHLLSLQSLSALSMGLGAGGIAGSVGFGWGVPASVGASVVFGCFTAWLIATGMKLIYSLRSSGNIHLSDAIGLDGVVTSTVPAHSSGRGRVRLVINQRMREYDAVSEGDALVTRTEVQVLRIGDDHTLHVMAKS